MARHLLACLLTTALAVGSGCKGDGNATPTDAASDGSSPGMDASTTDAGPPTFSIVARSPDDGDEHAFVGDAIEVTFSSVIDPDSITDTTVTVTSSEDGALTTTRSVNGDTLRIEVSDLSSLSLPATWTVSLTESVAGMNGVTLPATGWELEMRSWSYVGAGVVRAAETSGPAITYGSDEALYVAMVEDVLGSSGREVRVAEWSDGAWTMLGASLNVAGSDAVARDVSIVTDSTGRPVVAWVEESEGVATGHVMRWEDDTWVRLDEDEFADVTRIVVRSDDSAAILVGAHYATSGEVRVFSYTTEFTALTSSPYGGTADGWFDFSVYDGNPSLVYFDSATFDLVEWDSGSWTPRGASTAISEGPTAAAITHDSDGVPYVAWVSEDTLIVTTYASGVFSVVGQGVEADPRSTATLVSISVDGEGVPLVGFLEDPMGDYLVARWDATDGRWVILASRAHDDRADGGAMMLDAEGEPIVVVATGTHTEPPIRRVHVHRWNRSSELPFGIDSLGARGTDCIFPEDSDPDFPDLLSETGCFTDLESRTLIDSAVSFDLTSPLWSDGAFKERAFLLPEGETITYQSTGPLGFPVGTVFVKTFLMDSVDGDPSTRFPMETRFLVKRCEPGSGGCTTPFQGYSYQWRTNGSPEADLLPDAGGDHDDMGTEVRVDWAIEGGMHTHIYPSRQHCVGCHNEEAGFTLGLQIGQLNRNIEYDGVIDHQLRVLDHLGIASGWPDIVTSSFPNIPAPEDVTFSTDSRARAYLNSNCSHCHRQDSGAPETPWPAPWNFRYETVMDSMYGVCNDITPGDPDVPGDLHERISTRGPGQMPPLATDLLDPFALELIEQWITETQMEACD